MLQDALIKALRKLWTLGPVPVALVPGAVPKVVTKILDKAVILGPATTVLADCAAIDLHNGANTLAITVETTYDGAATRGTKIHVLTSRDNVTYDTFDWDSWSPGFTAGASIVQTKGYDTAPAYVKVLVENLDPTQQITNTKVFSTVG